MNVYLSKEKVSGESMNDGGPREINAVISQFMCTGCPFYGTRIYGSENA